MLVPSIFANATNLVATALAPFTIVCNTSLNTTITWIRTANRTGQFFVPLDSRVTLSNSGLNLNIGQVGLLDEEYYACVFQNSPTTYRLIAAFYLYVKGRLSLVSSRRAE